MKVAELKALLDTYPQEAEVLIWSIDVDGYAAPQEDNFMLTKDQQSVLV